MFSASVSSSTSPLLPSWVPITITARDVLEISDNAIRLKHRLAVPRSRDLKSRPFSGRLREVTIEAMRNNRLRTVTIDQVKNTTGLKDVRCDSSVALSHVESVLIAYHKSTESDPPDQPPGGKTAASKRQDIGTTSAAQKLLAPLSSHVEAWRTFAQTKSTSWQPKFKKT